MTNYEMKIFSKLLEVNWEIKEGNHSGIVLAALDSYYFNLQEQLIDSMGSEEYKSFIKNGREMFAPKI